MASAPRLSIVIPVRDEADSLEILHRELDAALAAVDGGVEILFVDDGSCDGSLARLSELARKDGRIRVLALARTSGQSAALDAGFHAVRGEITATLDADLQNDPADLPRLLDALQHADVVNGVRLPRRDAWPRRAAARAANLLRNLVTAESVSDVGCSLRVIRTAYLRRIRSFRGMHRFLPTLLRLEGARVIELPVAHRPRRFGRSKVGVADRLLSGLTDLLAVRWMQSRRLRYEARELDSASPAPASTALRGEDPKELGRRASRRVFSKRRRT